MTPDENAALEDIWHQLCDEWPAWDGGFTDAQGTPYRAAQYLLRANVQLTQLPNVIQVMLNKQAAAKPPGLLRSDVNAIAAAVSNHPNVKAALAPPPTDELTTVSFWQATAERAVRAFAASMLSLLGAGVVNILAVPWTTDLSISGGVALVSVLTSLVASQFGDQGTPSFLRGGKA